MKIPIARGNGIVIQLHFFSIFLQPRIGPDIDTAFLSWIYFAPALKTATAGAVTLVLRTLRHRAEIGHIDESAVTAVIAVKEHNLG